MEELKAVDKGGVRTEIWNMLSLGEGVNLKYIFTTFTQRLLFIQKQKNVSQL